MHRYLRFGYHSQQVLNKKDKVKQYKDFEAALQARIQAVKDYPGDQSIERHSAISLTRRGTQTNFDGTVEFIHDLRANNFGTMQVLTVDQTINFLERLPHNLVLMAERGFPEGHKGAQDRLSKLKSKLTTVIEVPGTSHHLHLDVPELISDLIIKWMESNGIELQFGQSFACLGASPKKEVVPVTSEFFVGSRL